ncbi:class I SAM-dependent methyltransferase [Candidatus Hodarchaeum mangrovi]
MANSSLLSGGKLYDLMVNWDKRLKNEIPFLDYYFKEIKDLNGKILEVACGTGRHLEELNKLNYNLFGLDIDSSMIEIAKKRLKNTGLKLFTGDFLKIDNFQYQEQFDGIFCLGNAIGLIAEFSSYAVIIQKFSEFLLPNGILIFHLLNLAKERKGWSQPRYVSNNSGEFLFLRGFTTSATHLHPEILTLHREKDSPEWRLYTTGSASIPRVTKEELISILEKNGFIIQNIFGDYESNIYISEESIDMIFVCKKIP